MTPTTKLEGLLPANGAYTADQQIIAEAVEELREWESVGFWAPVWTIPAGLTLAFTLGIAVGLLAGWVW